MKLLRGARSAYASCRAFVQKRPAVKFTLSALVWLPLASAVIEYGVSVKTVRGRSMQVRPLAARRSWREEKERDGLTKA